MAIARDDRYLFAADHVVKVVDGRLRDESPRAAT